MSNDNVVMVIVPMYDVGLSKPQLELLIPDYIDYVFKGMTRNWEFHRYYMHSLIKDSIVKQQFNESVDQFDNAFRSSECMPLITRLYTSHVLYDVSILDNFDLMIRFLKNKDEQ